MLQSHVPTLGLKEGSSGRKGLEGGGAGNKLGHGRALCGPHWFTGIRRGFIPSPAAMPNAPVRSWSVGGSRGVLGVHPGWDSGSALARGARGAILALQPQRLLPPQHKSWKINGKKSCASSMSPAPGSVKGQVRARVWDAGGLARAPSEGWCCPGDWSCQRGWAGWHTAGAILGCPSVRMPVCEAAAVPAVGWGPLARPTGVPAGLAGSPRLLGQKVAGGRSSSAGGRQGLGVGL